MKRWKPGKCPRCGGTMFLEVDRHMWYRDKDSYYEVCLQCSYSNDLGILVETKTWSAQRDKEPALSR
ncbi:unnamed protein product [marine sediment metagenome]|uniref:Uncharacterized protein n=1 Tax=marine sediment metagenome TaxID=412755 RepID=X0XBN2_9ZZZZ